MIEINEYGDVESQIFHDERTIRNIEGIVSWASSRHINFDIPEDVPLPPQLETLRHEFLSVIKGKQEEAEHTIGIFNQNLRDMYHMRNTLVSQFNYLKNQFEKDKTELKILQEDDIVDVWFKHGNGIFHLFEEEVQTGKFSVQIFEANKAITHNCTVTVTNTEGRYTVKTVPDFLTVFRAKVRVKKRGAELKGQWLSVVVFKGDPYEIHGAKIEDLSEEVSDKRREIKKLKEELDDIVINLQGKEEEIEKLDSTFKELAEREEFYSRYYFKVYELHKIYTELNQAIL